MKILRAGCGYLYVLRNLNPGDTSSGIFLLPSMQAKGFGLAPGALYNKTGRLLTGDEGEKWILLQRL
jgi:hypothetical protein